MDDFEAFLNEGGIVESGDAMPGEYRQAVFRFIEMSAGEPVRNTPPATELVAA